MTSKNNTKDRNKGRKVQRRTPKRNYFKGLKDLFYSGFCLTDNINFSLFYVSDEFLIDNEIDSAILVPFKFTENDFVMDINKDVSLLPKKETKRVRFEIKNNPYKFVDRELFSIIESKNPRLVVHPLNKCFDIPVNDLLVVLSEKFGKPVAVLKLHQQ